MLDLPERIGRYRVVRRLGASASGTAVVARADEPNAPEVVLKRTTMPDRRAGLLAPNFVSEATAYARLVHPGIVKVLDFFSSDGQMVLAYELVDGRALNVVRAALKRAGEPLDDRSAVYIATRVFAALAAAHAAKDPANGQAAPVVHRDLNPSRILLAWDGEVKITCFGVAKTAATPRDSQPGTSWGSYGYLAPEQVKGEAATPRSDVYAAAIVLWEMLTNRKAIERGAAGDWEMLKAMASPKLPPLDEVRPDLPKAIRDLMRVALDPLPEKRDVTADAAADVLVGAMDVEAGREALVRALEKARPDEGGASETAVPVAKPIGKLAPPRPGSKPAREEIAAATSADAPAGSPGGYRMVPTPLEAMSVSVEPSSLPPPVSISPVVSIGDAPKPPPPPPAPPPKRPTPAQAPAAVAPPPPPPPPRAPHSAPAPAPAAPALAAMPPSPPPPLAISFPPAPVLPPIVAPAPAPPPAPAPAPRPATAPALVVDAAPARSGGRALLWIAAALVALGGVAAIAIVAFSAKTKPVAPPPVVAIAATSAPPPAPAPAPAPAPEPAPALSSASAPAPSPAPSASAPPASDDGFGEIDTSAASRDHRIFVDGRVVGETPAKVRVRCGSHQVKIGSQGTTRTMDVPCGGSVAAR